MKYLKLYENLNIDLNVYYQIKGTDTNGDIFEPVGADDANYNPYDLSEIVKLMIKMNRPNLHIVKISEEVVDDKTLNDVIEYQIDKYNL